MGPRSRGWQTLFPHHTPLPRQYQLRAHQWGSHARGAEHLDVKTRFTCKTAGEQHRMLDEGARPAERKGLAVSPSVILLSLLLPSPAPDTTDHGRLSSPS